MTKTREFDLEVVSRQLKEMKPAAIVRWAAGHFDSGLVLSTSFGVHSALMLHLVTNVVPTIPVIFIDTGFHFPETYQFADELTKRLSLNLKVFQASLSPAWMSSRYGHLWEQGLEGLNQYDQIRKIKPMQRALDQLKATGWLAGLRRDQTTHRRSLRRMEDQNGVYKIHPILTWTSRQVQEYLANHDLPLHPLHKHGYKSIGDWHSTKPVDNTDGERSGRYYGLKQECGLHMPETEGEKNSRDSSGL